MLNPTEINLIQNRINFFKQKKSDLLKLKKDERHDELEHTNKSIATLKRWLKQ